ncbi:MAG: MFS transporter [Candidatus Lokiarchaeota archaeon]|nr:MFS transporter [Candidatus Lokiarchaeota archaeon]
MSASIKSNNLETVKRKNLLAISFTKLLHGFGSNIFSVIYQPYLLELTNSLVLTGIIISIGSIMQFLPMPFIGKLSDRYNRKILITSSMPVFMMGVFLFMIATPSTIYYAVLGILIYFLGFTINGLNSQFIVSESSNKSKGLIYGFMFFSFFLGSIGGSTLVVLSPNIDTKMYFLIFIGVLAIEGIIYGSILSNKTQTKKSISLFNKDVKEVNLWINIFRTKTLRSILIFFTLDIFVYGITLSIYNAGLYDFYNLTTENIAILSIGLNITNMLFQIPAGRITDKLGNKKALILSQFFGLGFFTMNIMTVFLWINGITSTLLLTLLFGQISFAFSIVMFIPAEQLILTDLGKERKAEYYGIINFVRGIGFIPTGYIGSLMVENIGYLSPFIFSFVGVLLEIIFLIRFFHHHSNEI